MGVCIDNTQYYNNLHFCTDVRASLYDKKILDKEKKKVFSEYLLTWKQVENNIKNKKKNPYFEVTKPDCEIKPYIDLDGYLPNADENEFNHIHKSIVNIFKSKKEDFVFLQASKYKHENKEGEIKNKLSYRITYHKEKLQGIHQMAEYIKREKLPILRDLIGDIIEITYGNTDNKGNGLDIDPAVYRVGGGKMRTIKAYKEANMYEIDRINIIESGSDEDHFLHYIKDCKLIELDESYSIKESISKTKNTKIKLDKPTKINITNNTAKKYTRTMKKREMSENAVKPEYMVELLNSFGNNQTDWQLYFNIGSCLAHNGYDFKIFDDWCKLNTNCYDIKCKVHDDWNDWVDSSNFIPLGLIYNRIKNANIDVWNEWKAKYIEKPTEFSLQDIEKGDYHLFNLIRHILHKLCRYSLKEFYIFNEKTGLWSSTAGILSLITKTITDGLDYTMMKLTKELNNCNDDKLKTEIRKNISEFLKAYKKVNNMSKHIQSLAKEKLNDPLFSSTLDSKVGILAFQNGILDMKTKTFREGLFYEDYLTETIKMNYSDEYDENKYNTIKYEFKKICNWDDKHLDYLFSIVAYSLTGYSKKEQLFWFITGSRGANGKNRLFLLLSEIMPCYVKLINSDLYDKSYSKKHKILMGTRGKRICYCNEYPKKKSLDESLIKELRDGEYMEVEKLHSTTITMPILWKIFIISNFPAKFSSDGGMERSFFPLKFDSHFGDYDTDDFEAKLFKKNKDFNEDMLNNKLELIHIMLDYAKDYFVNKLKPYPTEFNEERQETLALNDTEKSNMEDIIEYSKKNLFIDDLMVAYGKNPDDKQAKKDIKELMNRMGYIYNKDAYCGTDKNGKLKRGGWTELRIKTDYEIQKDNVENHIQGSCNVMLEEEIYTSSIHEEKVEEEKENDFRYVIKEEKHNPIKECFNNIVENKIIQEQKKEQKEEQKYNSETDEEEMSYDTDDFEDIDDYSKRHIPTGDIYLK